MKNVTYKPGLSCRPFPDGTDDDDEDVPKFTRAGRRGSCLIRADSKSDLYTVNGTTVNVDLIQPEHKPVTAAVRGRGHRPPYQAHRWVQHKLPIADSYDST